MHKIQRKNGGDEWMNGWKEGRKDARKVKVLLFHEVQRVQLKGGRKDGGSDIFLYTYIYI